MGLFKMSKEAKVGLVVVVAGCILYFGFQFLKGKDFMSTTDSYYAKYANVQGLTVSNPVLYKGYAVGRVEKISYDLEKSDSIEVMFEINDDIAIPAGSKALIQSTLLGEISVELRFSKSNTMLEEEDFLVGEIDKGMLAEVEEKITPTFDELELLLSSLNAGLGKERMDSLGRAFENLNKITEDFQYISGDLKGVGKDLKKLLQKLNGAVASVDQVMASLNKSMKNLESITDSLEAANIKGMIASLDTSMKQLSGIMTKINEGEGTLGKLVTDKALYESLYSTIDNIDFLAADFQANPHRYVNVNIIGKKPEEITMINRVKPSKLKGGDTHMEIELKLDIPDDLNVNFYDMTEKTISAITFTRKPGSTTIIEFDIPSGTKPGEHAVRVSWNGDKDTDYASVVVK